MSKILRIAIDVGLVLLATIVTIGIGYAIGDLTLMNFRSSTHSPEEIIYRLTMPCTVMACQMFIGVVMIWALHERTVSVGEIVGLVLWPTLFYLQNDKFPGIIEPLLFSIGLIATFARIRYHVRKGNTVPAPVSVATSTH